MNPSRTVCDLEWTTPDSRRDLLEKTIPQGSCVYAITVKSGDARGMLRIGATAKMRQRIRNYKILDLIPGAEVSWWMVSEEFKNILEPFAKAYFESTAESRPKHLRDKSIDYCMGRELGKIEFKAELVILEAYKRRHNSLPPGNAKSGSKRSYIPDVEIVEKGGFELLDLPSAVMPPTLIISGNDLISLLW